MNKVWAFISEVRLELSKVTWARFDEFVGHTVVVCITVACVSAIMSLMDTTFSVILQRILS
ncbi:preprotein translocase subunit SecE [Candidatus Dependentiae bacterium]